MHFGSKWRAWIRGCLNSARASVLVNGSPTPEFSLSRGVRQGDPLSTFLFIIAMVGLHVAILEASSKGLFQGLTLPNSGPSISHLLFAYDVMFVGKWSTSNAVNLTRILRCFHLASGLKVNSKSKVMEWRFMMTRSIIFRLFSIARMQSCLSLILPLWWQLTWDWLGTGNS